MSAITNPAVRRLIRRELRQNRARTVALFCLTFLPVAFVGFVAVVTNTESSESSADHVFGQADAVARTSTGDGAHRTDWPGDPATVTWVESGTRFGGHYVLTSDAPLDDPLLDGHGLLNEPWLDVTVRGRLPTATGQAAVTSDLLAALGLTGDVGETFDWTHGPLELVGVLEVGAAGDLSQILVAPGSLRSSLNEDTGGRPVDDFDDAVIVSLLDWDGPVPSEIVRSGERGAPLTNSQTVVETRDEWIRWQAANEPSSTLVSGLFMTGLSIATGAIAYAAWGSSIRRRLRDVGLLAASGGEPRHAAAVQAGQAFLIASVAAVGAIGAIALLASATALVSSITMSEVRWPIGGFVAPALIAIAVATLAGWWPARSTARMPLAALLAGRRVSRPGIPGTPLFGVALIIIGLVALGASVDPMADHSSVTRTLTLGAIGLIAISVGVLPILSALFRRIGSDTVGQSVPVTLRLVLRDASRHAGRSAATVLGIGAVIAAVWAGAVDAEEMRQDGPIAVQIFGDDGVETIAASTVHVLIADPVPERRMATAAEIRSSYVEFVSGRAGFEAWQSPSMGPVYVASTAVSAGGFGGAGESILSPMRLVSTIGGQIEVVAPADGERTPAMDLQVIELVGLDQPSRAALAADDRLETVEFGPPFEATNGPDPDAVSQLVLLAIGFVVAAVVIGLVTAMAAGEVREDLDLITLVGVGPRFRSHFLGLQAFVATAIAVLGGLTIGTIIRLVLDEGMPIPWHVLLPLLVLPAVLAGGVHVAQGLVQRPRFTSSAVG